MGFRLVRFEKDEGDEMSGVDIKTLLLAAPDNQLDASMHPLITGWDEPPTSIQVLEVLDRCIHGSLASSFLVSTLQAVYDMACEREGKQHQDNVPLATWRNR